jgi:hypothetical protein
VCVCVCVVGEQQKKGINLSWDRFGASQNESRWATVIDQPQLSRLAKISFGFLKARLLVQSSGPCSGMQFMIFTPHFVAGRFPSRYIVEVGVLTHHRHDPTTDTLDPNHHLWLAYQGMKKGQNRFKNWGKSFRVVSSWLFHQSKQFHQFAPPFGLFLGYFCLDSPNALHRDELLILIN